MAMRNGPPQGKEGSSTHGGSSGSGSASEAAGGAFGGLSSLGWRDLRLGSKGLAGLVSGVTAPKPSEMIGFSGCLLTEDEGGKGCTLCFAWCCELPGNAYSEGRPRATPLQQHPAAAAAPCSSSTPQQQHPAAASVPCSSSTPQQSLAATPR